MINCFLIGKDTSVCVRFFTHDAEVLMPWVKRFDSAPCHVHSDYDGKDSDFESAIQAWLSSSSCVSAAMFIDSRMTHVSEPSFLAICAKAKHLGVFTGLLTDGVTPTDLIKLLQPNWILPLHAALEVIDAKVSEILGVVRFSVFTKEPIKS